MNKTTFEKGEEKGRQAMQNMLFSLGKKRLGPLSCEIDILDLAILEELAVRILDVQSWNELLQLGK